MTCDMVRLLLPFARSSAVQELAADEARELSAHLRDCPDCAAAFGPERAWDRLVARQMRQVEVPPDGKRTVLRLLARLAWVRFWTRVAVAVALVGLGAGLATWCFWPRAEEAPYWSLSRQFTMVQEVLESRVPDSAEAVEAYFRTMHQLEVTLPQALRAQGRFDRIAAVWLREQAHEKVPVLEFRNGASYAVVYLLPTDVGAFNADRGIEQFTPRATILPVHAQDAYLAFVVVRSGELHDIITERRAP